VEYIDTEEAAVGEGDIAGRAGEDEVVARETAAVVGMLITLTVVPTDVVELPVQQQNNINKYDRYSF